MSILGPAYPALVSAVVAVLATTASQAFAAFLTAIGLVPAIEQIVYAFRAAASAVEHATTEEELRTAGVALGREVGLATLDLLPILINQGNRLVRRLTERLFRMRPGPPRRPPAGGGGQPRTPGPLVVQGGRGQITLAELMQWERQGGHALARHGPQHTRRTLLQRILGEQPGLQPQPFPAGGQTRDFRIWQGHRSGAASRWSDQATMQETIGEFISRHIDDIERLARGEIDRLPNNSIDMGRTVGEGWLTTSRGGAQRAAFWKDDLQRARVEIRADGNGGWYVLTAYPSL